MAIAPLVERVRRWKASSHEERVEQAIDRLMLVEAWLFWYIEELNDLRLQLAKYPELRLLVPIMDTMIKQLWQLMRRWAKAEVIRKTKEGLMKKEKKIEGDGFAIKVIYHKNVIDLLIYLHGNGDYARIPSLGIDKAVLRAMRMGWRASDSSDNYDKYPTMGTHFIWQVLSWLIVYPNTKAWIYARGISVSLNGVKPRWELYVNGFSVEWSDDVEAYREMVKLQRDLLAIAVLHSIFGDGSSKTDDGRKISLTNDDRTVLEELRARLEEEFGVKGSISPDRGGWRYSISGSSAKGIAEVAVKALEKLAPAVKRLYDLLGDGSRYVLIWFEKWSKTVKASVYVHNESKVSFANVMWSPWFTNGGIELKVETKDINYAEELRERLEAQGISATITKYIHKRYNTTHYKVIVRWSELKKYLCNEELRGQLIRSAMKAIKNCRARNMTNKGKRRNCDETYAAQWLRKLTDHEWLKSIGCQDND